MMDFAALFREATGRHPYPYQLRLARQPWPDLVRVPTGMGKTAAVALAWLFKRGWGKGGRERSPEPQTPRRLVWCLPMRSLAEQTAHAARQWLARLGIEREPGQGGISVHLLMGGEPDLKSWAEHPEEDMILVGTQDMLLSRALMRGYGISRYQWPVQFSFLHNDCLWVLDEVQLMGEGLATACQLEAFRRALPLAKPSRTLFLSATLDDRWLATVDFRPHLSTLRTFSLTEEDTTEAQIQRRLQAAKRLVQADVSLTGTKSALQKQYLDALAQFVLEKAPSDAQTIVIVNRVNRAQELFQRLSKKHSNVLLVHSRFRPQEREALQAQLQDESNACGRIVVATQALEAGVDVSSKVLITELAPWSSLVQRFGRCNRYGEHDDACIYWVDIPDEAGEDGALPYAPDALAAARARLGELRSASPGMLPPIDEPAPWRHVIRRKDFLDLFDTDPDLSGFDLDISRWVRGDGEPDVQLFWREFDDPNEPCQPLPVRAELCNAPLDAARKLAERAKKADVPLYRWDALAKRWVAVQKDEVRPGLVLLAHADLGGYDEALGLVATSKRPVRPVTVQEAPAHEGFDDDWRSEAAPLALQVHLADAAQAAARLCEGLEEREMAGFVEEAARWHDVGKAHWVFQAYMHGISPDDEEALQRFQQRLLAGEVELLAKSSQAAKEKARRHFRHELASMLAYLQLHDDPRHPRLEVDLVAYLVLAHHGKVRLRLRALPEETAPEDDRRWARGVWEGDRLPAFSFDGVSLPAVELSLELMEIGEGAMGRSWTERVRELLRAYGPFRLAWAEALVRLADWRASALRRNGGERRV